MRTDNGATRRHHLIAQGASIGIKSPDTSIAAGPSFVSYCDFWTTYSSSKNIPCPRRMIESNRSFPSVVEGTLLRTSGPFLLKSERAVRGGETRGKGGGGWGFEWKFSCASDTMAKPCALPARKVPFKWGAP